MNELIDTIHSPADIKRLSIKELQTLAAEIREFLLESLSKTGGHLGSNLGVIELTLALHYVFDFATDQLVWDVGHQCYTHKIITGRKDGFTRLRQYGGVSGFPDPEENVYDQFKVGHAGTSIPTAIGIALGEQIQRQRKNDLGLNPAERRIVSFVGDASIVNGNSFEGLNNLGLVKRQLLIVLNDNNMSIDRTVGALAKYFSKIRLSHTYEDLRKTTKSILEHVPKIGRSMEEAVERIKKQIRMALPASQLFESMNIPYFGPVDGHDIDSLVKLFIAMSEIDHPVLLHVHTNKGKGFSPASTGSSKFHSCGPFDMTNGNAIKKTEGSERTTFTQAFGKHITELARHNHRIVTITSAMCDGTGLNLFRDRFPDRFYDVGIAESTAVDIAAGLAHSGMKPVVCIYSTFLQRSFDQIFQEVSIQNLPVVFCIDRAGYVGPDGATHHGFMDIGYLRMMPNLVLCAPANEQEMKLALEFALKQDGPVAIRYPKDKVPAESHVSQATQKPFELGKSVIIKNAPKAELVLVNYGSLLHEVREAERLLADKGFDVGIINARFAAPVDKLILSHLNQGKKLLTIEDHGISGGFGSAVLELAATDPQPGMLANAIRIMGAPRICMGQHSRQQQLMQVGLNAEDIAETAIEMMCGKDTGSLCLTRSYQS